MELTKEIIEAHKLGEDTVKAIQEYGAGIVANEKNAISEALKGEANRDAEGILNGALKSLETKYGFKYERPHGEKIADSASNALGLVFSKRDAETIELKKQYEEKVKGASGADLDKIKAEYQQEKDDLLKKYADYDEIKEKASKADAYGEKLTVMQKQIAYGSVKPNFPESVNTYEAKAKWEAFIKETEEKYIIELDENNEPLYKLKENEFVTGKLADLVAKDKTISELAQGRKQGGLGSKPKENEQVEGVPFKVDLSGSNADISKTVREYLVNEKKLDPISDMYTSEFKELYNKIMKQKTAK